MLGKDSVLYAPILGIFVFTGFPLVRFGGCDKRRRLGSLATQHAAACYAVPRRHQRFADTRRPATQSGYLFTRCVKAANADAERMDKMDGL